MLAGAFSPWNHTAACAPRSSSELESQQTWSGQERNLQPRVMSAFRLLIAMTLLACASAAGGQEGQRGSIPPGQSRDGAAPSEGALKGGTILPGETGGMPDSPTDHAQIEQRCKELSGTLREDCLRQGREAASRGSGEANDTRTPQTERAD
jgi:hypothetical protein